MRLTAEIMRAHWDSLAERTAMGTLGIELVHIDEETLILGLEVGPKVHQPMGLLHGGVSALLAETAASMHAALGTDPRERLPVGIDLHASHLRSTSSGRVLARAKVLRKARSLVVHDVEIIQEESGALLSVVRVTNLMKVLPTEGGAAPE